MIKPLPILKTPHPVLRKRAKSISAVNENVRTIAKQMISTLAHYDHKFEIGAAIAAPQVGESVKLIVIRKDFENARTKNDPKRDFQVTVNPEIVESSDELINDYEGCLSIPGIYGYVKRAKKITVTGLDLKGKPVRITASNFDARVLQHEIDHLSGILFTDRLDDMSGMYRMNSEGHLVHFTPGHEEEEEEES